ncbi:MAG: hypothetical protein E7185_08330 [Erysipelotrichaceae bacterium]|nr:hypothetical protein [Erysipelotrichaceae bacterium]
MADQVTNYQCPSCGGPLHWDATLQKLKCDFCGSTFSNAEIEELYGEANAAAAAQGTDTIDIETLQWTEEEAKHLRAYSCPSCGAQLICDENTAATSCPYCGNPTIVPAQFTGALKPDYVIPFKLTKDQAVAKLREFYNGKPLLPDAFTKHNHIQEIKGVYVPFWLYDARVEVNASFRAERSHSIRQGDDLVTTTEHYRLLRGGSVSFERVPADASSKMPDEFMDAVEPYNYAEMVPFEMSYLPGYLADRYDVEPEVDAKRAENRMRNSTISELHKTVVGYSGVFPETEQLNIRRGRVHYALLPVWMLSTQWNGNNYLFAMNGQTGRMVGDMPTDNMKMIRWFLIITIVGIVILFFVLLGGKL